MEHPSNIDRSEAQPHATAVELIGSSSLNPAEFEAARQSYFVKLGIHVKGELSLHKAAGLWDRTESGEREWGNVSEHCLVEAARAKELSELLGLTPDLQEDLISAAALHDFYKKGETEMVKAQGLEWAVFAAASAESDRLLTAAGISPRVVRLAGAIGHTSLAETEQILAQPELSAEDTAYLVMHYIDDYTVGSSWAEPAEVVAGEKRNSLDQRIDKNEANERYQVINEEGRSRFNGRTTFVTQRAVGNAVEAKLAQLVANRSGQTLEPKDLPVFVDDRLRERITTEAAVA